MELILIKIGLTYIVYRIYMYVRHIYVNKFINNLLNSVQCLLIEHDRAGKHKPYVDFVKKYTYKKYLYSLKALDPKLWFEGKELEMLMKHWGKNPKSYIIDTLKESFKNERKEEIDTNSNR